MKTKFVKTILLAIIALVAVSGVQSQDKDKMTKKIYEAYSVMNMQNVDKIRDFITEDFIEHSPFPDQGPGAQGLIDAFKIMLKAYPDMKMEVKDIIVSDDLSKASVLFRMTGTNSGEMMGMPPTNKAIDILGIDWLVFKGDKASEHWGYVDTDTMMKQLGLSK
jgi:steroid delta-isomerase-like uncharacterized protein